MRTSSQKRVAIIHDWMNGFRGGEQVLDALVEIYPDAEIFTLFYTPGTLNERIESRPIHASLLNKIPGARFFYRHLLPLFPWAIERFDLSGFDLVISSSHCVAKGVIPAPGALHVCYCHTPMRYAWDRYQDYFGKSKLEPLISLFMHYLRTWDVVSSHRVDHFIANSEYIRSRIARCYRRDSQVVYPPLETARFSPTRGDRGDYYLIVSAFAPYKRIDLAIQACEKLKRKLFVVGTGQDERQLKALAGDNTVFLGRLPHSELNDLLAGAKALLFPGEEDFGIAPLEAMAAGTPVIAYGKGGALETIIPHVTGLLFDEQTVESLESAILECETRKFLPEACVKQAQRFSRDRFQREIRETIEHLLTASTTADTPQPSLSPSPAS